jgi:hypothetical protein
MLSNFLLTVFLTSCNSVPATVICEDLQLGRERDECLHTEIKSLDGKESQKVLEKAKLIQDPMIRGAAVSAWIGTNNNEVDSNTGQALCALLDGRDRSYCMRRLSSPHLKR